MLIHFSIFAVILFCGLIWGRSEREYMLDNRGAEEKPVSRALPYVIVFGYITFLAAMRSNINDTSVYVRSFNALPAGLSAIISELANFNIKFSAFNIAGILFKRFISSNYHLWFALFAAVESGIIVRILRKDSVSFFDSCYILFAGNLYFNYFSMMRQWFAVVIVFSGIYALAERRMVKYILICFLAGLFHPSAFLMIPVYFLVQGKSWSNRQIIMIFGFAVLLFFLNPILNSMGY